MRLRYLLPILLLGTAALASDSSVSLEPVTLKEKARLALPFLRGKAEPAAADRHVVTVEGDTARGEPARFAVSLDALTGKIGHEKVEFLDADGDGTCLTPFTDFLVGGRDEIQPVAPLLLLGARAYSLTVDEGARKIRWSPSPVEKDREVFPRFRDVASGLAHLNGIRAGLNLLPLALNEKGSAAAMLHLRYCQQNKYGHREEEGRPGYTRDGEVAGLNSLGHKGPGDVSTVIDGHLSSLLHRMELLDPALREIGIAADGDMVWIDTECGKKRAVTARTPYVFPSGDWGSGLYEIDNPDARPEGVKSTTGIPVTVAFYVLGIRKVHVELNGPGGPVPCYVNDERGRELKTNRSELRAVLMPKRPLASARYRVRITWEDEGSARHATVEFRIR